MPERYNFGICNHCGLVWADDHGMEEKDCPRCRRDDEIAELREELARETAEREMYEEELDSMRDSIERLLR